MNIHLNETMDYCSIHLIACATVIEEMLPLLPAGLTYQKTEFGLHTEPEKLHKALQSAIDEVEPTKKTLLLGYGLCSRAIAGLHSPNQTLVIPRVDDCIGIFLGSDAEYQAQHKIAPGTLYQTKGWLEGDKSLKGLPEMIAKYGEKRARFLFKQMIKNYTRMVFINTGNYDIEHYRAQSQAAAAELGLAFEEIPGSNTLLHQLLKGEWDSQFVVKKPGEPVTFSDFRP